MRGWQLLGATGVVLFLGVACGKTAAKPGTDGSAGKTIGNAGADDGDAGAPSVAGGSSVGGATSTAGTGGVALPPDGPIPPAMPLQKLDLLLMIDNSRNMLVKQELLSDAVTWLLNGGAKLSATDIHIGVVTSSLGSHGSAGAKDVCVTENDNDHARLLGSLRGGIKSWKESGFLAWGPDAEPELASMVAEVKPMIAAASEEGCGYEASLEAWYRFLVDPEPPASVVLDAAMAQAHPSGVDAVVLQQRAAFLRPDSVLAVVTLSDENDCSIVDEGYGWLMTRTSPMYRSTSACSDPNDNCCQTCGETVAKDGCPPIASDPECAKGGIYLAAADDDLNLRCYDQKRRFGLSLLLPIERYRDGLTRQLVFNRSREAVPNPIFAGHQRHPSQVVYTGIVGVPWQDVADTDSLSSSATLNNLTAKQLSSEKRWAIMLGDPDASPPVRPADPFMIETPRDRGILSSIHEHPLVNAAIVPSDSKNPQANFINGHDTMTNGRDLQTACIFPLAKPKLCDQAASDSGSGCRCFQEELSNNAAFCQPPAGGEPQTLQYFEGAYPGIRHLQLQKALGDNAVTASICPKVLSSEREDYGYRPAMRALAERLERAFNP